MAKTKGYIFKDFTKQHSFNALCGVVGYTKATNGSTYPALNFSHEDIMRLYEMSKYLRARGQKWISVNMWDKKRQHGAKPGRIKAHLSIRIPDRREIIYNSTLDRLTVQFDGTRDPEQEGIEPFNGKEFRAPTKGYRLRKGDEHDDFVADQREVTATAKEKKVTRRSLNSFDKMLADSIAKEEEQEQEKKEIIEKSDQAPEPPAPDEDTDDNYY
jgi:hypothetical protein